MTFARSFKLSSYCLFASGFIAIWATGAVDWPSALFFVVTFISSWFLDTGALRNRIPIWILNCLALTYLPFFALDYLFLSRSLILSVFHLLLFTAAIKLLTLSKDRDYILLYLISLTELLAASTLTVNIVFAVCFLVFLFCGISTLVLFEMRRTNARVQKEIPVQPLFVPRQFQGTGMELFSAFPAGLLAMMVVGIALLVIIVSIPIFFILPRITYGMYGRPSGNMQFTTGFSERVELGQIGNIKQSDAVVMRVKLDRDPSELHAELKWRGLAFDYYDGRAWQRTNQIRGSIPIQGRHYKLENSTQGTDWIHQTFFLEALSTDVIFATPKALAVSVDVGLLLRDGSENLYAPRSLNKKLRYSVVSDPVQPDPANISDLRPIPPEIIRVYTQTPPEDPRIKALAQQITKGFKDKYSKALAMEQYLRTHYGYSLVLRGKPSSPDPLAAFLFDIRSGHCEYFASAMTIMLRQLGIPARLVNGFRMGEYNRLGNSWTVRQYNAHSWVEAYFPPYGWIEFDPTPPDSGQRKSGLSLILANLSDAIDLWWWDSVINYDFSKQAVVLVNARSKADSAARSVMDHWSTLQERLKKGWQDLSVKEVAFWLLRKWAFWIPLMAIIVVIITATIRARASGWLQRLIHRRNSRKVAASFYMEALAALGAEGMQRGATQTPLEFARSIGQHPAGKPFLDLTKIYNSIRFGPPEAPFHRTDAEILLRELRVALRRKH